MYVKSVNFYGENEASVVISDGEYEILCYAYPFENKKENSFTLSAFMSNNVMRALENNYVIERKDDGYYAYKLQGKLVDIKKRLMVVGKIVIELEDNIPKDIKENEFVELNVMRIDLVEKN